MEVIIEEIAGYLFAAVVLGLTLFFYLRSLKKKSDTNTKKIEKAKEGGFYEPVSLHPVVNENICIGSGACIEACPEKDILGLVRGKATTLNASRCVGHGACFHACPVQAITLYIGTEKRGVELPHVSQDFETNVGMIFIAGELGGMGLIRNAVEQGKQAVDNIAKKITKTKDCDYDLIIIGAGPAGISASLRAKEKGLNAITLEQDTLGGTVYSFPRAKVVMTSPVILPLYGKVKLGETSKSELLGIWNEALSKNNIQINESEGVTGIASYKDYFEVTTVKKTYRSNSVLLAIGRRGTPRKLGVKGEEKEKVYYRLLEPELIKEKNILVVGGGDSAIESALLLAEEGNNVHISYRSEAFSRLKPKNLEKITSAINSNTIKTLYNTTITEIFEESVLLKGTIEPFESIEIPNDLVFVFAGGELPGKFLEKCGITITKKFGVPILSHEK
ncbi:MAG: NAD(P)-binding domain-containing protein [Ignavibacteriaceae bacterium]|nr:NAD(P)-binding domain-containing protein [Ignavibacteriaceae bacterium]